LTGPRPGPGGEAGAGLAGFADVVAHGVGGARPGRVEAFDAERGLGTVVQVGGASFEFHSTAISDGSRQIAAGSRVAFVVSTSLRGRFEATSVHPVGE